MRGPKPCAPIHVSPAQEQRVQQLVQAHATLQFHGMRARIVLVVHDHPDGSNQ